MPVTLGYQCVVKEVYEYTLIRIRGEKNNIKNEKKNIRRGVLVLNSKTEAYDIKKGVF